MRNPTDKLFNCFGSRTRKTILVSFDIFCFILIDLFYFFLSRETTYGTPVDNVGVYFLNSLLILLLVFAFRYILRSYSNVWRYTNTSAYFFMVLADAAGGVLSILVSRFIKLFYADFYIGIWHAVTVCSLTAVLSLMSRFSYRLLYKRHQLHDNVSSVSQPKISVAIAGAGQLGAYLAHELVTNPHSHYQPKCFIDIDTGKIGATVAGLPVYSNTDIDTVIEKHKIAEVIVAIARISSEKIEELYNHYNSYGCKVKIYDTPFTSSPTGEEQKKGVVRDFSIEDLLFRKPIAINDENSLSYYKDKTVLVTGGGGSIGSEICRQIARCGIKQLIIFDIYENNAYDIQQELLRRYGSSLNLAVEIGSVRDKDRLDTVFDYYRPNVVFHAAAHKHVPLMEHSNAEAIKNNVMGTYNSANCAERYGVEKFILVSTDKAVNPTNIMGASKRLCEMVIQCRLDSATSFSAVRFGNVLGSNGSVIPLFKRQIAQGGPVTITDRRIIRYFMTIPEASSLVIQAGSMAKRGELFVLDMGKPVRIYDLAVNMIKLMGYTPDEDIKIEEIGLRPGEKLYEELLMKTETLAKTDNNMIFIERDTPYTRDEVEDKLRILLDAVENSKSEIASPKIKEAIKATVPTFFDPEELNEKAVSSEEFKKVALV